VPARRGDDHLRLCARSTAEHDRTRSPTANCSNRDCSRSDPASACQVEITSIGSRRSRSAVRTSPARGCIVEAYRAPPRALLEVTCFASAPRCDRAGGVFVETQLSADLDLWSEIASLSGDLVDLVLRPVGSRRPSCHVGAISRSRGPSPTIFSCVLYFGVAASILTAPQRSKLNALIAAQRFN